SLTAPVYLSGSWQNEKYFKEAAETIRRDFTFPDLPQERRDLANTTANDEHSVSVHIRRGDYAAAPLTNQHHGLCSPEYYAAAIQYIRNTCAVAPRLFLFSDEPGWVRDNFDACGFEATIVESPEQAPWHDMHLMSLCRHHITANSSFSWWGAWLGETDGGVVCAPSRWFIAGNMKDASPIPDRWVRL
ncbi:MAG: alpha-1,2-fucosyltransferase, partial [Desulfovibrio sp.]|nr:alpha-1,2-fucosyltransferase [Desulfovibrio sp.]